MSNTPPGSPIRKDEKPIDEGWEDTDSDSDDPFRHTRPTLGLGGLMSTYSRANLHSYKATDEVVARENAVDDSEDLPDIVAAEAKGTGNYGRRSQRHNNKSGEGDPKIRRLKEIMPFPFHPNVRPLTVSDLESCVVLEDEAFDPEHRATREKFEYRLSVCPELCLGLFCTIVPDKARAEGFEISTLPVAKPVETGRDDGAKSVLVAHIIATRSNTKIVTDDNMDYPRDFRTKKQNTTSIGHQEEGQTVCVHSLAVHPKFQGCHLGKLIMLAYLQQLKNAETAKFCALICRSYLIPFYKRFDFRHMGPSKAQFGGGGWHDMTLYIDDLPNYGGKPSRG